MAESFSPAPGKDEGSSPQGHEPTAEAPTQSADTVLFRRYRVIRELGRGGMGVVLLAHDTELDIDVAVKLVPDLVVKDTEAINDLRKEVLRGMALNHDGVVRTHHFEKDESGAGIVMEFIEGDNLTDLKVRQPGGCFDPEQLLPWLDQLCAVLDYAHREKHLIHRDLKPRNIMLCSVGSMSRTGESAHRADVTPVGRIKVADFGVAAVISDSMSRHSMEGKVSGTLSYMSPQQLEGKRPSVADDIHALGATIYELLTGKPPFFRGSQAVIYQQILNVVPPSMAERRADLEVSGKAPIPPHWEETIAACLAKEPSERPSSAGEVLARLRAPRNGGLQPPTPAPEAPTPPVKSGGLPPALAERRVQTTAPLSPPRSRAPLAWGALAAVALAAGGTYYFGGWQQRGTGVPPVVPTTPTGGTPVPLFTPAPPPTPMPPPSPTERLAAATKEAPFINSLGMEFVPVPGTSVLFCRWETRVKDYRAFADATKHEVEKPSFAQTDDHPAVNVSWDDAKAFCAWLSKKEGREYRLPTDEEWSTAVGLPRESGTTPADKDMKVTDLFPWGTQWPPPKGAGNFADGAAKKKNPSWTIIDGYDDGFADSAPVGSFTANRFGIYDLGGNVWEWCEDLWKPGSTSRVLRGGSFYNFERDLLLSSSRNSIEPAGRYGSIGYRCVVVVGASSGR